MKYEEIMTNLMNMCGTSTKEETTKLMSKMMCANLLITNSKIAKVVKEREKNQETKKK